MSRTWVSNSANSNSFCQFLPQQNKGAQKSAGTRAIGEPGTIKGLENKRSKNSHPADEVPREPRLC